MTNWELNDLRDMIEPVDGQPESAVTTIVRELVRRELQRLNPDAYGDPCEFYGGHPERACRWGTFGCASPHKGNEP
jgi:hypothetical protein